MLLMSKLLNSFRFLRSALYSALLTCEQVYRVNINSFAWVDDKGFSKSTTFHFLGISDVLKIKCDSLYINTLREGKTYRL